MGEMQRTLALCQVTLSRDDVPCGNGVMVLSTDTVYTPQLCLMLLWFVEFFFFNLVNSSILSTYKEMV